MFHVLCHACVIVYLIAKSVAHLIWRSATASAQLPLRQLDGVLKTVETMDVPLSKGQPDGAVETEDVDTDGALLARTPARVLARVRG